MLYTSRFSSITKLAIVFLLFAFSVASVVANTNNYVGPTAAPPGGQPTIACDDGYVLKSVGGGDSRCVVVGIAPCSANQVVTGIQTNNNGAPVVNSDGLIQPTCTSLPEAATIGNVLPTNCGSGQVLVFVIENETTRSWECKDKGVNVNIPACLNGYLVQSFNTDVPPKKNTSVQILRRHLPRCR